MANVWVLQDMIASQPYPGRSKDTRVMRQFAKQFFQWRFRDGCTIKKVTERFKTLFRLLDCLYGLVVSIDQPAWEGRDDAWNKIDQRNRSGNPVRPMFHDRETGKIACGGNPHLAFPIEIVHDHLWFKNEICIDMAINQIFGQTMTLHDPWAPVRPALPIPNHHSYHILLAALNESSTPHTAISDAEDDHLTDRDAEGESDDEFS